MAQALLQDGPATHCNHRLERAVKRKNTFLVRCRLVKLIDAHIEHVGDNFKHVFVYHFLYGRSENLLKPLLIGRRLRRFHGARIACGRL